MSGESINTYGFSVGQRVELHPATDAWASGDRYGDIVKVGNRRLWVKMDRSGKIRKMIPANISRIVTA